jgi:hypothetical protein
MRHHAALTAICAASALLLAGGQTAALGAPRSPADTIISGTANTPVGKCSYSVTTDSTDYTSTVNYTATLKCGSLTATATGAANPDADGTDEDLGMDEIKVSAYGQSLDITTGFGATIPVNAQTVADIHTFWDQAVGVMAATSAEQAVGGAIGAVTASDSMMEAATDFGFDNIVSALNSEVCDTLAVDSVDQVCSKTKNSSPHDALLRGVGGDLGLDEKAACPPLAANPPSDYFVVCMPTFIAGNLSTSKNIFVTPGGALMALPLTGSLTSPLGSPTVKSSGSIIAVGAGIAGAGVNLVAGKDIDIAGSMIGTLGPLTFQASAGTVNIGSFSLSSALSFIASLFSGGADGSPHPNHGDLLTAEQDPNAGPDPKLLDQALTKAKTLIGSVSATIPAFVDATALKISAKNANISSGSEVSVSGWGLSGAAFFGSGTAAGGAKRSFGGSHAGLGGFSTESTFAEEYLGMGGRGHSTDNPFNPTLGGGGGGGDSGDAQGKNGGGVLTAVVPGTFTLNGTVSADGDDPGWIGSGDHGGGGAGGSVNLTVGTIAGSGTAHANGGILCSFCVNGGGGGLGGGGMVAVSYATTAFKGSLHALPGYNPTIRYGTDLDAPYDAPGGAGTVFTIQRAVKGKPAPKWAAGVLTIDGRGLSYPADDGTPLPIAWNNPKRALIVADGAVGYGTTLNYGSITLKSGSRLTTLFGTQHLSLTAPTITVDKTSRIDVSDRGYAGGNPNDSAHDYVGKTAPGKKAATGGFGGSHGGAGGANSQPEGLDHAGATYDSVTAPALPGGGGAGIYPYTGIPGGGVIILHATTLSLAGVITANGGSTEGPTSADPIRWPQQDGGAGAGGAIQVIVTTLTGAGIIQANGGNNCLGVRQLLRGSNICTGSSSGGGGGGRVAVTAPHRKTWTGHVTAVGGVNLTVPTRASMKGKNGTVWLSKAAKT